MLGSQMVEAKMEDNNKRDNDIYNPEVEHRVVINWTPPDEKKFLLKRRFVSPRMLSRSLPRRSRSLFGYRMSRSLNVDITSSKNGWLKSPNSSLDSSSDMDKSSSRDLSRSAKIMRALSLSHGLIRHKNVSIKKSLNFDSPPSPQKSAWFNESPHSDSTSVNTSFDKLLSYDTNSIESATSSVLIVSSDSIDENQNQTPQKSRKVAKITNGTSDTKENLNHSSESSGSTSLLQSNLKERIDNILHMQTPDLHSFKREKSKTVGCVASTPRNLIQEFNQNVDSRPQTPENIMRLIPESMSAIKKSHKQEKLYRQQEDACTQQMDYSMLNKDRYMKTEVESLEADRIIAGGSCDTTSMKKSQMGKKSFKKTLIYDSDDELSDSISVSDHSAQWNEATSKEDNSSENRSNEAKINKIQDINLSDREKCEGSNYNNDSVSDNDNRKDCFERDFDKEVYNLITSQRKSSSTVNTNVSRENVMMPPAPNPSVSQNSSRAVTPENYINLIQQVLTESIKKSHKKVKHESKKIFKPRSLHQKIGVAQVARNSSRYESIVNATCSSSPNSSFRPNTPDNINSSRLLLTEFNSVKKSHKKDKHNKRISGLAKCHKYQEYRKRSDKNRQDYVNKIRQKNSSEAFGLKDSPDASPKKKKKSNVSAQSEACMSPSSESSSWGCKNIEDEFKIHTPLRTSFKLLTASTCVCMDESSEKDGPVQATPKEVDLSRCMTPIAHCSKTSRENEDAVFEGHAHVEKSKTDVSHDGSANATVPEDENGRSTPTNVATELLCDINSIKKSHKKNKHSRSICKRGRKEPLDNGETKNVSFASDTTTLEEHAVSTLQRIGVCSPSETGMCSNVRNGREDESYEDSQPSTSRINDSIRSVNESNLLNVTPPNDFNAANFVKLFSTTSIKKFHKKERDYNAETKYILMSNERDLSDDGSIFDEEDRLNVAENFNSRQDMKCIDNL
ncbi:hypothetical protein DMN91_008815 [Ooceraea biroi]|uniref:Uncharacterized protein n=1 Tax=Ooceraea biroi TaxID=2015173 RepID=A0A3L8DEW5_OOCBI|nr:hypothetical protein DMN91_008815 [Ooceraea biroi]